ANHHSAPAIAARTTTSHQWMTWKRTSTPSTAAIHSVIRVLRPRNQCPEGVDPCSITCPSYIVFNRTTLVRRPSLARRPRAPATLYGQVRGGERVRTRQDLPHSYRREMRRA